MAITDKFAPQITDGSAGPVPSRWEEVSANGACPIADGTIFITKGSACAITLDAPPLTMNGAKLTFESTTDFAHTVTYTAGFNGGGSGADVATFANVAGNNFTVIAWQGVWYKHGTPLGVTFG